MIIGLTGRNGSGKGAVAEYLKSRGFRYISLSDVLRNELEEQGRPPTRENLYALGNQLRDADGAGALAKRVVEKINTNKNYIIDSIRHPDEVKCFRIFDEFEFWEVYAPEEVRFKRLKERGRAGDPQTLGQFMDLEAKESASDQSTDQQLVATLSEADFRIKNDSTLESLQALLKKLLDEKFHGA